LQGCGNGCSFVLKLGLLVLTAHGVQLSQTLDIIFQPQEGIYHPPQARRLLAELTGFCGVMPELRIGQLGLYGR